MVKQLVNKDVEWIPDPTLCLNKNEWIKLEKKPLYDIKKPYVLLYFLGEITEKYSVVIQSFKQKNLEIVNILDPKDSQKYLTNPKEFLWLIDHAEYVCTDSFHATVFSIIFESKFIVFERIENSIENGMFSRIQSLLDMTNLQNCKFSEGFFIPDKIDFEYANNTLKKIDTLVDEYLSKALN